jgi:uncharacterized protein YqcC (DUF446 family)
VAVDETRLIAALDAVAAELDARFAGLPAPTEQEIAEGGAFGHLTMSFAQWLRFVFVPIARVRIGQHDIPAQSMVAAQAVREFDGLPDCSHLTSLLAEFDALVEGRA